MIAVTKLNEQTVAVTPREEKILNSRANLNQDNRNLVNDQSRFSSNRFREISVSSGVAHNIPHRFNEIKCIRSVKCIACKETINFGKAGHRCSECHSVVHINCVKNLPNNCGLPKELMDAVSLTSHSYPKDNYALTKEYLRSSFEPIEVDNPVPSAPLSTNPNSDSSLQTTDNNDSDEFVTNKGEDSEFENICQKQEFTFTDSILESIQK